MNIRPIRTEEDYNQALKRISEIWDSEQGTDEYDELDVLTTLIITYEDVLYHIDDSDLDPIDCIEFHLDRLGWYMKDLVPCIGSYHDVLDILRKKKPLTLTMIRNLSREMNIDPGPLVKEYPLVK